MGQPRVLLFAALGGPAGADRRSGRGRTDGAVAWRLLAANNRELGRSAAGFATEAEALASVRSLQSRAGSLTVRQYVDTASGRWAWGVEVDGLPVARSARLYLRSSEAHYSLTQFVGALPVARISEPGRRRTSRRGIRA